MEEAGVQGLLPHGKTGLQGLFPYGKTGLQGLFPLLSGSGIEPQRVHRFSIYMKKTHKNNTIPF